MSDCSALMRPVSLEMSVVSTRSWALWPLMSDCLRSIFFWIWDGDWSAEEPTGSSVHRTNGAMTAKAARMARRNRMQRAILSNRLGFDCRFSCMVQDFHRLLNVDKG